MKSKKTRTMAKQNRKLTRNKTLPYVGRDYKSPYIYSCSSRIISQPIQKPCLKYSDERVQMYSMSRGFFMFQKKFFSKRVFDLRKQRNLKQEELATIVGVKDATISAIERGQRAASIEVICALADYFGVTIDYLVGHTDEP